MQEDTMLGYTYSKGMQSYKKPLMPWMGTTIATQIVVWEGATPMLIM